MKAMRTNKPAAATAVPAPAAAPTVKAGRRNSVSAPAPASASASVPAPAPAAASTLPANRRMREASEPEIKEQASFKESVKANPIAMLKAIRETNPAPAAAPASASAPVPAAAAPTVTADRRNSIHQLTSSTHKIGGIKVTKFERQDTGVQTKQNKTDTQPQRR
jgi:hypothetical protein